MNKPIIGIVAKHYEKCANRLETFIRDEVEQAVFDNGGIAIGILPPNVDKIVAKDNWQEQLTPACIMLMEEGYGLMLLEKNILI